MTPIPDYDDIIGRVERATGGDRELDRAIMVFAFGGGVRNALPLPEYTSSVDAALALVERKLPGYRWSVGATGIRSGTHPDGKPAYVDGFRAGLTKASPLRPLPTAAHARTAPLAIILALLRALSQQGER